MTDESNANTVRHADDFARFRWLCNAAIALEAMLEATLKARQSVRLEMYIFSSEGPGVRFRAALVAAAQRGVRVRVLIDALGSLTLSSEFWQPLQDAGGEFRWFNPISLQRLAFRDHRKVLVVDDDRAFLGGFNIAPEYDGDGIARGWYDMGMEVAGPLARELAASVDRMWDHAEFRHRRFQRLRDARQTYAAIDRNWQLLLSGPGRRRGSIKRQLNTTIRRARLVRIISAYFLPPRALQRSLMRAARHGAQVQLILPAHSDVSVSLLASRGLYAALMRAGVEIYEYQPQILHAKLVITDEVAFVGSSNLDLRSLNINYEVLAAVSDRRLVEEAQGIFTATLKHCVRVNPAEWRRSRNFWNKMKEQWACFLLSRIDPYFARLQAQSAPRS
jgi:cardiolipin synthase